MSSRPTLPDGWWSQSAPPFAAGHDPREKDGRAAADMTAEQLVPLPPLLTQTPGEPVPTPSWDTLSELLDACAEPTFTLIVPPGQEEAMCDAVQQRGWSRTLSVKAAPTCPPGRLLLVRTPATDEELAAVTRRSLRGGPMR